MKWEILGPTVNSFTVLNFRKQKRNKLTVLPFSCINFYKSHVHYIWLTVWFFCILQKGKTINYATWPFDAFVCNKQYNGQCIQKPFDRLLLRKSIKRLGCTVDRLTVLDIVWCAHDAFIIVTKTLWYDIYNTYTVSLTLIKDPLQEHIHICTCTF